MADLNRGGGKLHDSYNTPLIKSGALPAVQVVPGAPYGLRRLLLCWTG